MSEQLTESQAGNIELGQGRCLLRVDYEQLIPKYGPIVGYGEDGYVLGKDGIATVVFSKTWTKILLRKEPKRFDFTNDMMDNPHGLLLKV